MNIPATIERQTREHDRLGVRSLSFLVAAHGLYILALTLLGQIAAHHGSRLSDFVVDIPLLIGLSLVYLATLLRRRKHTAWLVTVAAYVVYLILGISGVLDNLADHAVYGQEVVKGVFLPLLILGLLIAFRKAFVVRSDIQGFRFATRFAFIVLGAALVYGVVGFSLLDVPDFHQEISFPASVHYTVDQFDLTTNHPLHPYTKRAHLFVDSLSFISVAALAYVAVSLFQPLRVRLSSQAHERELMHGLLKKYGGASEEFFKLWPHDKHYFFDDSGESGLAFSVHRGVALCLGDPAGNPKRFDSLLESFSRMCFNNDWLPALVHVAGGNRKLYEKQGFALQKLGEEAVLNLDGFKSKLEGAKYFRQIRNKFAKQGFACEILEPPHHQAVLDRLSAVSREWLEQGGRAERGFAMGYYAPGYMQLCRIMVVRDAAGTIQAFANLIPADFDDEEATYDLLRRSGGSPGNITDFLLMELIDELAGAGYKRLNLGLCPLVGLDSVKKEQRNLIDNLLHFAYANGDRFYSFSGLRRFKAKYEPEWDERYVGYQEGVRNFSRTMAALMRAMKVR